MAISTKGKRRLVVDGETFLWRHWNGGAQILDLAGQLNVYCASGVALVKGPRFRAVKGCGGLHRFFRCPQFFWVVSNPRQVAKCIRWAVKRGPDPEEIDRTEFRMKTVGGA